MRWRMIMKIKIPKAITDNVTIRPFLVKNVNSKNFLVKGIRKVATIIPIIVSRRVARRGFKGFEIQ